MTGVFLKILNMSINASWLVLFVLVLRLMLKKAPKWITVALWAVVAVRLVCPAFIESEISLVPKKEIINSDILSGDTENESPYASADDTITNNTTVSTEANDSVTNNTTVSTEANDSVTNNTTVSTTPNDSIINGAVNSTAPNEIVSNQIIESEGNKGSQKEKNTDFFKTLIQMFSNIWLVGIGIMALYFAISYLRLYNRMKTAVLLEKGVYQSEKVYSPFVFGIIFPKIYVPFNMSKKEKYFAISHEKAHVSRKDNLWKPLGFLLLTVHWFNLLMWVAYILLCKDIEFACDEKVIKNMNSTQKADYAQALLGFSVGKRNVSACPVAFGETNVKRRVFSVINYKKPTFWIIVTAIVLCVALVVLFLTDPVDKPFEHSSDEAYESSENQESSEASTDDEETKTDFLYKDLVKKDLEGREFYITQRWFGYGKNIIDFTGEVLYMENEDGTLSSFNQTKADIIGQVQKDYNCKIKGEIFGEGSVSIIADLKNLITTDITAKTYKYDFFFESIYLYTSLAKEGMLKNIKDIETINLQSTCWDKNAVSELSISNKLYFITGDINTHDNNGTVAVLFNKYLYEKFGYKEDLYKLVRDREWTFDKLLQLASDFEMSDSNQNGIIDEWDNYFMGSQTTNLYYHVAAAGEGICKKDENDVPYLTMTSERGISALEAAIDFYNSGKVLVGDLPQYEIKYENNIEVSLLERALLSFTENREIFLMTPLYKIPYLRQMEDEFGILPVPMYSKEQGEYYSSMDIYQSSALMIPNSPKADDNLGIVIQALAELSEELLTPSYYEKMLSFDDGMDEESRETLDIIYNSRHYDLGQLFGAELGDVVKSYADLECDDIKAKFEEKEKLANEMIEEMLRKFGIRN